jgi:hypothetical protein
VETFGPCTQDGSYQKGFLSRAESELDFPVFLIPIFLRVSSKKIKRRKSLGEQLRSWWRMRPAVPRIFSPYAVCN